MKDLRNHARHLVGIDELSAEEILKILTAIMGKIPDGFRDDIGRLTQLQREQSAMINQRTNNHGEINSNYGLLIYSDKFYSQYHNALDELLVNTDSRRATMIYTRPSIWVEYNENGKNDFICTNAVTYYIRGGKIHCVVQMRSNDVVYGYKNDYAWQRYVLENFTKDYNKLYLENAWDSEYRKEMDVGDIIWQVQNLHVYERHFNLVK